ncbi:hypothetical protein ACFX19_034034 [Malus domestica]
MREMQLLEQVKELESKQKEFDSIRKSTEEHIQNLKSKEKTNVHPEVDNDQQLLCIPATIINRDGRGLQLLMNEHLKRIDLVGTEISAVLQASSDPAKLVLNAMQGFYPSNLTGDNSETSDYDLRVIRRSCILLLQELKIFSPQISPQVREDALNLAADWKAKMTMASENDMEVLGFLKLVTVYDITTACDPKEVHSLLAIVAQHGQATELCQALKTTNKAPASNSISFPVKVEEPESSPVRNVFTSSSPNLQPSATTDATNMQGSLNEHSSGNPPMQNEMFVALQMSLHPEKLAFKLIKTHLDQCWVNRDVGLGAAVMENTISLLIDLAKVIPLVGSDVKKDAKELAVQWKAKLRADSENSFEILGFLQFISTYELLSAFNKDEIVKLFGMIYLDEMALNSHRTLGFSDKIPDVVQNLIERKQVIDAVKFMCAFKLNGKFSPALLLKDYVEDARKSYRTIWLEEESLDEKDEILGNQIAELRDLIRYIKDHNLESEFPFKDIESEIVKLEQLKENSGSSMPSVVPKDEPEHEKGKRRSSRSSIRTEPEQCRKSKRLRQMKEEP